MVLAINHVEVVIGVESDTRRTREFTVSGAGSAPLTQELALFIEDRDAVEPLVGGVDIFVPVQVYGYGPDELAVAGAEAAELAQEFMINGYPRDALAYFFNPAVDDVHDAA